MAEAQCDKIGRLLKVLGGKYPFKSSPNVWRLIGLFRKRQFMKNKLLWLFSEQPLVDIWLIFNPKSGLTAVRPLSRTLTWFDFSSLSLSLSLSSIDEHKKRLNKCDRIAELKFRQIWIQSLYNEKFDWKRLPELSLPKYVYLIKRLIIQIPTSLTSFFPKIRFDRWITSPTYLGRLIQWNNWM